MNSPPFLSIVTRTQGRRPHTLPETLASVAAQTDQDFELLLMAHRVDAGGLAALEATLAALPGGPRSRCRLIAVDGGTRTAPLNAGLDAAIGDYVAVLDDDDIALPNWIATFRLMASRSPGRMLRAATRQQRVAERVVDGAKRLVPIGAPEAIFPDHFDFFDQLAGNRTPPVALAFPRARLRALGLRFDETLTTTEDWDFIMRCAGPLGVATSGDITSIYRYWEQGECSRTVHTMTEWLSNNAGLVAKWDAGPFVLPQGGFRRLLGLQEDLAAARAETEELRGALARTEQLREADRAEIAALHEKPPEIAALAARIRAFERSTSWRMTAPLRWLAGRLR